MEHWKDVVGWEGFYKVSSLGNVCSLDRKVKGAYGAMHQLKGHILKQRLDTRGYPEVGITRDNKVRTKSVHSIVARAFLAKPLLCTQVNHKDGIKTNNDVSNLEWVTGLENIRHAERLGLMRKVKGADHYRARAVFKYDAKTLKLLDTFRTVTEAGVKNGIPSASICNVCSYWSHVEHGTYYGSKKANKTLYGYVWKYCETKAK